MNRSTKSWFSMLLLVFLGLLAVVSAHTGDDLLLVKDNASWKYNAKGEAKSLKQKVKGLKVAKLPSALYGKFVQGQYEMHFQTEFQVSNPSEIESLTLRALFLDQCVVTLNGRELLRKTKEPKDDNNINFEYFRDLDSKALKKGKNVLRAKIIHRNKEKPNMVWRAMLFAGGGHPMIPSKRFITRGPYLQNTTSSSLVIRWRTEQAQISCVKYQKDGGDWADASMKSLDIKSLDHSVLLEGLEQNTLYHYQVVSEDSDYTSERYTFKTAPAYGSEVPVKIWIIGDSGTANSDAKDVYQAFQNYSEESRTDVWLMLGDNAYQTGMDSEFQSAVFEMYEPLLHHTSLWSTLGNHETYWSRYDSSGVLTATDSPYFKIFDLPTQGEAGGVPSGTEHYYSFDYGRVHFICLDSQSSDRSVDGEMYGWLNKDLENVDDAKTDWVLVFFHHPPYTHGTHNSDLEIEHIEMRENFLPLLEKYEVDLVFGGHSHTYERSILMSGHYGHSQTYDESKHAVDIKNGNPEEGGAYQKEGLGTVYSVAGNSGKKGAFKAEHLPFMTKNYSELGSVILQVDKDVVKITAIDEEQNELDSYELRK